MENYADFTNFFQGNISDHTVETNLNLLLFARSHLSLSLSLSPSSPLSPSLPQFLSDVDE